MCPIDNKSALVQVMASCWTGNRPLSEHVACLAPSHYLNQWWSCSRKPYGDIVTLLPDGINIKSLDPGISEWDSKNGIYNLVLLIGIFISPHDNALWWMPQDLTDDKSTLVQGMAWCRQATSHYLSQCWSRPMSPNGVTRPQWVNLTVRIFIRISLKFVPKGPINNKSALVQIMAWCRSGDKPLSEPMMVYLTDV